MGAVPAEPQSQKTKQWANRQIWREIHNVYFPVSRRKHLPMGKNPHHEETLTEKPKERLTLLWSMHLPDSPTPQDKVLLTVQQNSRQKACKTLKELIARAKIWQQPDKQTTADSLEAKCHGRFNQRNSVTLQRQSQGQAKQRNSRKKNNVSITHMQPRDAYIPATAKQGICHNIQTQDRNGCSVREKCST